MLVRQSCKKSNGFTFYIIMAYSRTDSVLFSAAFFRFLSIFSVRGVKRFSVGRYNNKAIRGFSPVVFVCGMSV